MALSVIPTPQPDTEDARWAEQDSVTGSNSTPNKRESTPDHKSVGWGFPVTPQRNILNWWQSSVWKWCDHLMKYLNLNMFGRFSSIAFNSQTTVADVLYLDAGYIVDPCIGLLRVAATSLTISGTQQVYILLDDCLNTVTTSDNSDLVTGIDTADLALILVGDTVSFDSETISYTVLSKAANQLTLSANRPASGQGSNKVLRFRRVTSGASFPATTNRYSVFPLYTAVEAAGVINTLVDRRVDLLPKKATVTQVMDGTDNESFITPETLSAWDGFAYATESIEGKARLATAADVLARPTSLSQPAVLTAGCLAFDGMRPVRSGATATFGTVKLATNTDISIRGSAEAASVLTIANMDDAAAYATDTLAGFVVKASDIEAAAMVEDTKYVTSQQLSALRAALVSSGVVFAYYGTTAPAGYIELAGQLLEVATNTAISDAIYCGDVNNPNTNIIFGYRTDSGDTTRSTSGTHIRLPDMRGEFARGWDNGRGLDSGRVFGTAQTDDYETHTHTFSDFSRSGVAKDSGGNYVGSQTGISRTTSDNGVWTETAPRNITVMYIIKT